MLADADGSEPGHSTANWRVPLSKTAASGCPASGRTVPAGFSDAGGDSAGRAGSIVRGAEASGFDVQPGTKASTASTVSKVSKPKKRD